MRRGRDAMPRAVNGLPTDRFGARNDPRFSSGFGFAAVAIAVGTWMLARCRRNTSEKQSFKAQLRSVTGVLRQVRAAFYSKRITGNA